MTILNVAVGEREVAIITDSRQSAVAGDGSDVIFPNLGQKCLAFPHLGILVAHSGDAGIGLIVREWEEFLLGGGLIESNVDAAAQKAPGFLRHFCSNRKWTKQGRIIHAGIVGERAAAYIHDAPDWLPQAVPLGAWVSPSLMVDRTTGSTQVSTNLTAPLDRPAPVFRDSLWSIRLIVDQQLKENPVACGGSIIESYLDSGGVIRQLIIRAPE